MYDIAIFMEFLSCAMKTKVGWYQLSYTSICTAVLFPSINVTMFGRGYYCSICWTAIVFVVDRKGRSNWTWGASLAAPAVKIFASSPGNHLPSVMEKEKTEQHGHRAINPPCVWPHFVDYASNEKNDREIDTCQGACCFSTHNRTIQLHGNPRFG